MQKTVLIFAVCTMEKGILGGRVLERTLPRALDGPWMPRPF